ncbi:chemotaxis protein CheW [Butyrivibrio sp. INlla14]|uniref:chemotaxis protein CheW n=1 Tax=Butyrivibrio sp. INlla14 TaxID=1520808 RepID=UPI00087689A3|nr:chemotaxis protein CheW [Butyrivibrio sp. INlla14]SCY23304.1 purine-binding chemotaxis protein CheW [Butyrivibrio sp. INlla14]
MEELAVYQEKKKEEKKYVVFGIKNENFGIDISFVNSIIQMPHITSVPKSPEHYSGIITLRGEVVPVISLRRKMNLDDEAYTDNSRIIITDIEKDKQVGLIVDEVKEVVEIPSDEIMEPSPFLKKEESLISGVGKKDDELISVCNIEMLI